MRVTEQMVNTAIFGFCATIIITFTALGYFGWVEYVRVKKQRVCVKHHVKDLKWSVDKSIRYCRSAN